MDMQRALQLKRGDCITANMSWIAPERITEGRVYQLIDDASPYKAKASGEIVNVLLPIVDDNSRTVFPTYHGFD